MATPQVTAAVVLVKSVNPGYAANQVVSALKRAADVPDGCEKAYCGSSISTHF
jgi:subtilisin family serine protease